MSEATTALTWTPHPLLPVPSREELETLLDSEVGQAGLMRFYRDRELRIAQAEEDAFNFGFELPHWGDADLELDRFVELLLFVFGGNRAAKSEFAAKRVVETAVHYPGSIIFVLRESDEASIGTVQKYIWKYLPLEFKGLNGQRDPRRVFKVNYSPAGGFTEGKLVLPNGSEIWFPTYKQDPGVFEGFEIGVRNYRSKWILPDGRVVEGLETGNAGEDGEGLAGQASSADGGATRTGRRLIHNIGFWADEDMPLPWVKMLLFRILSRAAKGLWTFTPVRGLTPAIKQFVGEARTLKARVAELLPGKVNVEGCPVGTMPYIQAPFLEKSRVIYFHSVLNPFGAAYEGIKKTCKGMPDSFVQIRAYGYARDTRGRAFPNFSGVNIVKESDLPSEGTNYMVADPAGRRPISAIWARVASDGKVFIYRDWPEAQKYGDWAETSSNAERLDGDRGPAQQPNGFGVEKYVETWEECERVRGDGSTERDAYRKRLVGESGAETPHSKASGGSSADGGATRTGRSETVSREEIFMRLIDPRAGRNQHIAEKGGTCLQDQFSAKGMDFVCGSGVDIEEGVIGINEWLEWDREQPLDGAVNCPKLYVSERCRQVIWALQNWTGNDGEKGACKDFVDCVRYLRMEEPRFVGKGMMKVRGGGSY